MTWRPTKSLELSIWGQNLLDDRHSEFFSFHTSFLTEIPRSVFGKITWSF
jgi:iron complex outermembrane receptor protein